MSSKKIEPCDYGFENKEFTIEMKDNYTILAPDIFPIHLELIRQLFTNYGYNVVVLHDNGKDIVNLGLEHINNDMCYPVICMTGQQLNALKSGKYDPHKCALIQFQTGGGCRASNYIWMIRKALHNMGMDYVPVLSLSFNKMEKNSGFEITTMMIFKAMVAILYGDILMLLRNQVRPYEKNKGETDKVLDKWLKQIGKELEHNKGMFGKSFKNNLEKIAKDFHNIERLNIKKTKVGIVGEIYVKYSPFGNNGLEEFLLSQDCEYMLPGVLGFFQYMFDNEVADYELYGGSKKKLLIGKAGIRITTKIEKTFREVLKKYPEFVVPGSFYRMKELGEKVIGRGVTMGEGWLLPSEVGELIENGYNNVICVQPFGCLPNHIVGKGTVRTLTKMYPKANICPLDYDSSQSRVNQENRIKLMLAMAKESESE